MSTTTRAAAFVAALAVAFAAAWGVGRLVGPIEAAPAEEMGAHSDMGAADATTEGHSDDHSEGHAEGHSGAVADATGLTASTDGYSLDLADLTPKAGRTRVAFTIRTSSGRPLLDYTRMHEKDLHLIVVRRDLTGFQHVHPQLDPDTGEWSVDVRLTPGTWRVIADLTPAGWDGIVLADDISVAGDFRPKAVPAASPVAHVRTKAGTYTVTLDGDTAPGASTVLTTRVELDGEPVTDLEPYLGAYGHLVAIRAGDLGYLHVHPEQGEPGPEIAFATGFPTAGTYRLFLDFQHRGQVHTAAFTVTAGGVPHGEHTDENSTETTDTTEGGDHDH